MKCRPADRSHGHAGSLSLRRAWIEICSASSHPCLPAWSLSLRRAWIEICATVRRLLSDPSLSLRRAWIEMSSMFLTGCQLLSRSPYGERGLKYHVRGSVRRSRESLSLRRAWIEIRVTESHSWLIGGRSPYGERGLKCTTVSAPA